MQLFGMQGARVVPTAYYALHLREFAMEPHSHPRGEIMYAVSGSCRVTARGEEHKLREGQFILLGPGVAHGLHIGEDGPCGILNLEFTCLPDGGGVDLRALAGRSAAFGELYRADEPDGCRVLVDEGGDGREGRVGRALRDLIAELERKERRDEYLVELLLERALIEIARCPERDARAAGLVHLRKAKAYIAQHLFEELDVAAVAGAAGVNHSYLQSIFSRNEHCGVMAYVNRLRMEHAAFLLVNSSLKVTDIAFRLGYASRQHFAYTFEKCFHMRPREYRLLRGRSADADTGTVQWVLGENGDYEQFHLTGPQ